MVTVKVPATSANMGSGFDSIGVALQFYNTIRAGETDQGLQIDIVDETSRFLPHDERNLVYRAMQAVFDEAGYAYKGIHIIQDNKIPVTRGLGSSSASIVGGLLAANRITGDALSTDRLITIASEIEGHPDNTTATILGGMAIAVEEAHTIYHAKIPVNGNRLLFAVFIPNFILRTKTSRSVLPKTISHSDGVYNTSRAALLTAAMASGEYDLLKVAMQDRLHQPYRQGLIKGVSNIFKKAEENGALGSYISGAGPTVVSIIKAEDRNSFKTAMGKYIRKHKPGWEFMLLKPDNIGARIIKEDRNLESDS